jgi:uncharacterized protein (DUF1800 family)
MKSVSALDERAAVRRLWDRLGLGPRPGDLNAGSVRGFDATVAALLTPATTPPPPANLGPQPDLTGKVGSAARKQAGQQLAQQEATLITWWLDQMVATTAPLTERLTWFWHGHFATSEQKVRSAVLMQRQNATFRALGTGQFRTLAKAMMVDPAMLLWLDGQQNRVGSPNENLARESMELFLLGIGHYTETDVREAARGLTGWVVDRTTGKARFAPRRHDNGSKTVLGQTGDFDVNSLTDLVLSQPNSPKYVTGRLWYRLVSATPPPADVADRLVAAYGPNGDIMATLGALTKEPAFVDSANQIVKEPVEWAVGLMRALGVRPGRLPAKIGRQLVAGLRAMGQVPFEPPNVGGWPADGAWLTTSAALARFRVAQLIVKQATLPSLSSVDGVQTLLNVDNWSPRTAAALAPVSSNVPALVTIAACAPEYVVSL